MIKKVEGKVEGNDDDALNQNLKILERLKEVAGVKTDAALAEILGIKSQNVTQAKRRGIPRPWIIQISQQFNCDINILLHPEKNIYCGTVTSDNDSRGVGEKSGDYGVGLGESVDLLAQIINSGDKSIINALHSNLVAFRDAVAVTSRQAALEAENAALKKRISELEAMLQKPKIDELSRRIESIESLYREQIGKGVDSIERREIMNQLGVILGFSNTSH